MRQSRVDHFNAGAAGREEESGYEADQRARARQLYGSKDMEGLFPGQIPKVMAPWPSSNKRTLFTPRLHAGIEKELGKPATADRLVDIDPRILSAGQPHIVRAGVEHYLGNAYRERGETFEGGHNVGNQFPFVVTKPHPTFGHEHVLLAGHHRAAAALLRGERLRTRWMEQS